MWNPTKFFFNNASELGNAIEARQETPRPPDHNLQYYMNNGADGNYRFAPPVDYKPFPNGDYQQYESSLQNYYKKYYYLSDRDFIKMVMNPVNPNEQVPPIDAIKEFLHRQPGRQIVDFNYRNDHPFASIKKPGYFQMDIVFFVPQLMHLYIIETNSRKVWVIPILKRDSMHIFAAFESWYYKDNMSDYIDNNTYAPIRVAKRRVISILTDGEKSFETTPIKELCDRDGIQMWSKAKNEHRIMNILERSVATVKKLLYKHLIEIDFESPFFSFNNNTQRREFDMGFRHNQYMSEWIKKFNQEVYNVVQDYNNKPHPSLHGYTPNEVYHSPILQKRVLVESINHNIDNEIKMPEKQKFRIGDLVRFKERRRDMDKMTFWSDAVYKIINKFRYSYQLGDAKDGSYINGVSNYRFKHYELQLVERAPDRTQYYKAYNINRSAYFQHFRRTLERPRRMKGDKEIV